jgi:hypothetical protein
LQLCCSSVAALLRPLYAGKSRLCSEIVCVLAQLFFFQNKTRRNTAPTGYLLCYVILPTGCPSGFTFTFFLLRFSVVGVRTVLANDSLQYSNSVSVSGSESTTQLCCSSVAPLSMEPRSTYRSTRQGSVAALLQLCCTSVKGTSEHLEDYSFSLCCSSVATLLQLC